MVAVHDHLGQVAGYQQGVQVCGHRDRHIAPPVHEAELVLTGGDQLDRVPGLALGEAEGEVRVGPDQATHHGRDQATHRGREGRDPQVARDEVRLGVQPGLDLLQVAQQPGADVDQVLAVPGQHHAPTDPLEERDAGLPLQTFDLL